jgi:hypothetical protein
MAVLVDCILNPFSVTFGIVGALQFVGVGGSNVTIGTAIIVVGNMIEKLPIAPITYELKFKIDDPGFPFQ